MSWSGGQKIGMKIVELKYRTTKIIKPVAPYNFDATVFKPSHYPDPTGIYEKGKFWFAMRFENKIYGIKLVNQGTIQKPRVQINIFSKGNLAGSQLEQIIHELDYRFEFYKDISEFYRKFKKDKVLSPFLKKWYGMHGSCALSLYDLLMIGIFLQNTIIRRSAQMTKIMLEKYGAKVRFDRKEIFAFWRPEEMMKVPERELRNLKIGYRAKLFIKLSESFVREKFDEIELRKLPLEQVQKRLLRLYGVGPETARILLVEPLHHYEIFEHIAPWQQKIYSRLLFNKKLVPAHRIIRYIQRKWGKWAALAASYIWEDIFWQRAQGRKIKWLEKEIRL